MSANIVEFSHIRKSWGKSVALKDVSLDVRKGEILTLLGPSGCGKSTLMRIAAGFETATAGKVFIDGKEAASSPVMRILSPAWRFDVPIPPGTRRISLATTAAGDGSREDLADWVDAGFVLQR